MGHLEETVVDRARPTLYNGGEDQTMETLAAEERYRDLLCEPLSDDEIHERLSPIGFADWRAAYGCLQRMAGDSQQKLALADVLPHLLRTLTGSASPDRAMVNLERFAGSAPDRLALFYYLASNPRAVEILVTLFAGSQFLTEILLRHPEYFSRLTEHKHLARHKSAEQFYVEAQAAITPPGEVVRQLDALRRFQRLELMRIGACDLLDLFDLPAVTLQLSNLADSLVRVCLDIASEQSDTSLDHFAVIALGKLGGQELNYSSDIDLLFLAESDAFAYRRLGERLIEALASVTAEGFLYRVDMRLRPWGQVGALVSSLDGYMAYLGRHARLWEKQALLKARAIAGDAALGNESLRRADALLFDSSAETVREQVYAMKQRTEAHLRQQGRDWGEVKLGEGSIRDIEFVAQYLQLAHGAQQPDVRSRNTLDALARLSAQGLLGAGEYRVLVEGYIFLRTIEHHLQMMHYRQTDTLPNEPEALAHLARRLGFRGEAAGGQFLARYQQHCAAVRAVYLRHVGSNPMSTSADSPSLPPAADVGRHLARMDPSYSTAFSEQDIQRHAALAEQLDADHLVEVDAATLDDGRWRVTIVGYDYPGELSLICGLLFAYGFNINAGDVFTYEPIASPPPAPASARNSLQRRRHVSAATARHDPRRKIVDVFAVRPVQPMAADIWVRYADDLSALLRLVHTGQQREAQGELAKRAAISLREMTGATTALYPIDIEIDNTASDHYTVLRIDAPDTVGFLYEFTSALAIHRIYIARVVVESVGSRVHDTLYVTNADGQKITASNKQRELRAATVLIKHFTHLLPHSPNPESALLHFREFLGQLFSRPDWPDELASLERPEVLDALAQLLGVSDFLWDDFLRMQHVNLFPVVRDVDALAAAKPKEQLRTELEAALQESPAGSGEPEVRTPAESLEADWRAALNAFKDRELFRVDMRHILGHIAEFGQFSEELTDLAEVVVEAAYRLCVEELRVQFGSPCLEDRQPSPLSICALGKCGGRELGFASDIELMLIYAGNGKTTGPYVITTSEFYEKVAQTFVVAIRAKQEGIFQVDLQLRPYGKAGSMAVSLDAFRRYFAPDGPAWAYERQALVKLRPIAGDVPLGQQVVTLRDTFVYNGEPFDTTAMRAMRERQIRHLVTGGTFNAKYSPGGLVDAEYLVQGLQIMRGHRNPSLRLTNTREAMAALAAAGILSPEDYARLRKAHTFLRWLIDALRVVRGNAQDLTVPPADSEEFAFLARRLRYGSDVAQLREDLLRHTACVQELSARLLG
jgi:[glutamine synthetase] adenylyltransferase / [glutamine synthetase]-adenylyl-L-tyrosine phosphorylase